MAMRPSVEAVGVVVLLAAVLGVALGDATGWLRCEQHYAAVGVEMRAAEAKVAALHGELGRLPTRAELQARYGERGLPRDFWGRDFALVATPEAALPFALHSLGRDGAPGGVGEDADISSRDFDAGPYALPLPPALVAVAPGAGGGARAGRGAP